MIDLELLEGLEPQPKQKNSVKIEQSDDEQNSEQNGSLSDIFTAKGKKSAKISDKKIRNEPVDEFKVKNEYVQENQYENEQYYGQNEQYYGQNEQHYGQSEHEQYYGHNEHNIYYGQDDKNGENYAENEHFAENKVRTLPYTHVHIPLPLLEF